MIADIHRRVQNIIAAHLGIRVQEVLPHKCFIADLDVDSLDTILMVMGIEDEFGIEISDDEVLGLHTVGDVYTYLVQRCSQ